MLTRCQIIQLPSSFGPSTPNLRTFHIYAGFDTKSIFLFPYFAAFLNMQLLNIGGRKLEPLDLTILPRNMKKLRIDFAKLKSFPNFSKHVPYLSILTINGNTISVIPQSHIANLSALTKFTAFLNHLHVFPNVSHMKSLHTLIVNYNYIPVFPHEHICGLVSLQLLDASHNLLHTMPNISYLPKLESVDLSNNHISYVPASCLYGLPKVQSLFLNGNKITVMDVNSWHTDNLYLHDNMFTTPPDLYDMDFASLTLQGNPLVCDQMLCSLRMLPFNKTTVSIDNFTCSRPSALNGTFGMNVHPTLLGCYNGKYVLLSYSYTVYPKKYAQGLVVLCIVVVMQSFIMNSHEVFIHIHQGCFAGTGAIVRLPQCQWSKPDGNEKISQCITTTKLSKAKTVCIFLGIYCIWTYMPCWFEIQPFLASLCHSHSTDDILLWSFFITMNIVVNLPPMHNMLQTNPAWGMALSQLRLSAFERCLTEYVAHSSIFAIIYVDEYTTTMSIFCHGLLNLLRSFLTCIRRKHYACLTLLVTLIYCYKHCYDRTHAIQMHAAISHHIKLKSAVPEAGIKCKEK